MMAKGERGIPVQDGRCTEAIFGKRIGDDVSRSVNRPASKRERLIKGRRFAQGVGFEGSVRLWKLYCSIHCKRRLQPLHPLRTMQRQRLESSLTAQQQESPRVGPNDARSEERDQLPPAEPLSPLQAA